MKHATAFLLLCGLLAAAGARPTIGADSLTFHQVLQTLVDTYPSVQVAVMQTQRARQESLRVESQLGWTLNGFAGAGRDVSIVFSPTDRADIGAGVNRRLSSGGTVGLDASYAREDSGFVFSPGIPNPSHQTNVDLSYRQPLAKGAGNPEYNQGLVQAEAQLSLARANQRGLYDDLARQAADLYYGASGTLAALRSVERAVERGQRLKRYVQDNAKLGIAEDKDILQADAQLRGRLAERQGLIAVWREQRTQLNRLLNRAFDADFAPVTRENGDAPPEPLDVLMDTTRQYSPALSRAQANLSVADAQIALSRDSQRDQMDVVFSVGSRYRTGDSSTGSIDDSEAVGGVRFEYSRALDRRGVDAVLRQAMFDRDIALEQIRQVRDDLRYQLSGVLTDIETRTQAVADHRAYVTAEDAKLGEATRRYRQGRTTTEILIQFENDLFTAELQLERQLIELSRALIRRDLLLGRLWRDVRLPAGDVAAFAPEQPQAQGAAP
jgi:outer membrane protein TolC